MTQGFGSRGVYVMDGPDAEVEFWDNLRMSIPDPVLLPKESTQVRGMR